MSLSRMSILILILFNGVFYECDGQKKSQDTLFDQKPLPLYLDYNQPLEERVQDLISKMTLEEKAIALHHYGPEIGRFNIISDGHNQLLAGVNWTQPTTRFPVPIAMAATWDTDLIEDVASALSDEARAIYNLWKKDMASSDDRVGFDHRGDNRGLVYRQPVLNMSRNPYWGRIYEIWGEDPFLTGRMGVAFINGMQGYDSKYLKIGSTVKHLAVNNVEKDRWLLSATVSDRMLHEYWLPAFREGVIEGKAQSVMASYNGINGVYNTINKPLLTGILRDQWGFEGFVVDDYRGVERMINNWGNFLYEMDGAFTPDELTAKAMNAGIDLSAVYMEYVPTAVRKGLISEERLNEAVANLFRVRFKLGDFDPFEMVPYSNISSDVICSDANRQLALETAQKSMVLLSNKDNFLPLEASKINTIAVIGPHANIFTSGGYVGEYKDPVTPLQGIKNRTDQGTEVLFSIGGEITPALDRSDVFIDKEEEMQNAVEVAKKADVAIIFIGTNMEIEREGIDRTELGLPGNQLELVKRVYAANPNTVVVLINAGPLIIPWIKDNVPAIVEAWWGGEEGGNAIADVIFGNVNPGGRLPYTVYASESQIPPQDEYDISKGFTYMYLNEEPLFAFGHGLSYTEFKYADLTISPKEATANSGVSISVSVENIGDRAGSEVVQLYFHDQESSVQMPAKDLCGFSRIELDPREKQTVTFNVPVEKLSFYDENTNDFIVEPGLFDIMVGSSSEDIREAGVLSVIK